MKGINIMFSKEIQLMNMEVRLSKLSQFPVENKNIINKLKRRIANMRALAINSLHIEGVV